MGANAEHIARLLRLTNKGGRPRSGFVEPSWTALVDL